ncbi:hypothetical protein BJX63DRAFT_421448 [Aspergillus granulosus]|uniref:Mid2 domain-containing protein n=1 Tax=Aspergillus granulosus TaxID=176169 RepID=A0ABR4HCG5_9EURO
MASHGMSRHSRYERLLRRHRLDTRVVDHKETVLHGQRATEPEQKTTRPKNLHEQWGVNREKRQQVGSPSTTLVPTDPETESAHESEATATEARPTAETTLVGESETTVLDNESATTVTQPIVSEPTSVVTKLSTGTEAILETTPTAVTTAIPVLTVEEDAETVTESPPAETATTTDLPNSTTDTPETETVSESAGLVAGLTVGSESEPTSTSTDNLPIPSTSTDTTSSTLSTSVPIIGQGIGSSDNNPISIGSSLDIPTAVVAVIVAIAAESSTSSSDSTATTSTTSITSTTLATTSTTTTLPLTNSTTTTVTTSYVSHTSYSNSPTGGYGWGDSNDSGNVVGSSPESTGGGSSGSESNSDSESGSQSPQPTGKIVGGVVGGVAAATVIFLLLFLLFRRRKKTGFFFGSPAKVKGNDGDGGLISGPSTRQMVSRDSEGAASFGAAYFAPAFMKRWRQSQMSSGEESLASSPPSERGFQKISGRKLPSGMHPEFDYGAAGGLEAGSPTESDLSLTLPPVIPRSSISSRPPPSHTFGAPLDTSFTREVEEEDVVFVRPSPARTPTAGSSNAAMWAEASTRTMPMAFPMPPANTPAIPKRPDALGRSHPSYDGSRGSRFSEIL